MSADTDGQGPDLVLPEGYVAERYEDGWLRIYDNATGGWLGEIAPHLANAQEVAQDLITAHELSESRSGDPTMLGPHDVVAERSSATGYGGTQSNDAWDRRAENQQPHKYGHGTSHTAPADPEDPELRIRELEVIAALAADSLEAAGDQATAQVVGSVLLKKPEQPYSS